MARIAELARDADVSRQRLREYARQLIEERLAADGKWNSILVMHGLAVASSREIGMVPVSDPPFRHAKVACYRRDEPQPGKPLGKRRYTYRPFRHGAEIGSTWVLPTKKTAKNPACLHRPFWNLENEEFGGSLTINRCSDCGKFFLGFLDFPYRPFATRMYGSPEELRTALWKDTRRSRVAHVADEKDYTIYIAAPFEAPRFLSHYDSDRQVALDGTIAPEIEQRTLEAAWSYVLSSPDFREYRAPYAKVRELRDAGFSIAQMARKLKVSERTINNRLVDVPSTTPARPDLLTLRIKAGGGRLKPSFWPGWKDAPRGSRATAPSHREPNRRFWLPLQTKPLILSPKHFSQKQSRLVPKGFEPQGNPVRTAERCELSQSVSLHDQPCSLALFRMQNLWCNLPPTARLLRLSTWIGTLAHCEPGNGTLAPKIRDVQPLPNKARKYLTDEERELDFGGRWWERLYGRLDFGKGFLSRDIVYPSCVRAFRTPELYRITIRKEWLSR